MIRILSQIHDVKSAKSSNRKFRALWSVDEIHWEPMIGVDISQRGLRAMSRHQLFKDDEVVVQISLGTAVLRAEARVERCGRATYAGAPAYALGLRFTAMSAEDQAILGLFDSSIPESETLGAGQLEAMFPGAIDALVSDLRRYERVGSDLDCEYVGLTAIEGRPVHEIIVRSRVETAEAVVDLATRLLYNHAERGTILLELSE